MKFQLNFLSVLVAITFLIGLHTAAAQGSTAFTYQGQLQDGGTNANGIYTMVFALYDSASGGNEVGSPITTSPTLGNGLFTVNLDFGAGAFNGSTRWLDISVASGSTTQELSPRVQVLPAPYALFANSASNITGTLPNAGLSGTYASQVILNNKTNIFGGNPSFPGNPIFGGNPIFNGSPVFTSGSISLSSVYPSYGTSSWNIANSYAPPAGAPAGFLSSLFFIGGSGLPALQIFDGAPSTGASGIFASAVSAGTIAGGALSCTNVFASAFNGGSFSGNGIGLTNLIVNPFGRGFVSSGTFVVPTNVTQVLVEMWGGGGGGGSGYSYYNGSNYGSALPGGGGGAGEYILNSYAVAPLSSISITVGNGGSPGEAGGATSFGNLATAPGGSPGGDADADEAGAGGAGGTGAIGFPAGSGGNGQRDYSNYSPGIGGNGANATRGGSGGWGYTSGPWSVKDGNFPGGGGGGGGGFEESTIGPISEPGGNGGNGLVIIYYW